LTAYINIYKIIGNQLEKVSEIHACVDNFDRRGKSGDAPRAVLSRGKRLAEELKARIARTKSDI